MDDSQEGSEKRGSSPTTLAATISQVYYAEQM